MSKRAQLLYNMTRMCIRTYAALLLRLDVHWYAPLPAGPKIIVANHPSCSDPLLLTALSTEPLKILVIREAFIAPLVGAYMRWSEHIPVTLGEGGPAMETSLTCLRAGDSVALFPEGWVSPQTGGYHRPRSGAARLALATGVPVIPVGIHILRARNWITRAHIGERDTVGYWYWRGPYTVTVGEPLYFEGDVEDRATVQAATGTIMARISALAEESEMRYRAHSYNKNSPADCTEKRVISAAQSQRFRKY